MRLKVKTSYLVLQMLATIHPLPSMLWHA